jgi:uncharacterized membrane protein YcaP (DUF421 family)
MQDLGLLLFGPQNHVTWWQECVRAVVTFAYGFAVVRVAGRRVFGKWAALDIVVSVIVGSNLSRSLTGSAPVGGTLAATTLLMAMHWVLAHLAARSVPLSRLIEGGPVEIAKDGKPCRKELLRQSISKHDVDEALREHGIEDLGESRLLLLEPSGKITVLKRDG